MRALYLDCFSGISGDMMLGALLDAGADKEALLAALDTLPLQKSEFEVLVEKTQKYGITGTDVTVLTNEMKHQHEHEHEHDHDHHHEHEHDHHHEHEHEHEHEHDHHHEHEHEHKHEHDHKHHHGRNLEDITRIVENSGLNEKVKKLSLEMFVRVAQAEAGVHGKEINEIHFHEVGAVDSIVDIIGTAVCIDLLKIDKVFCSVISDGTGFIQCAHGLLPVPVPAVARLLAIAGAPMKQRDISTELVTPTGAAIATTLAADYGPMPEMHVLSTGYGFGKRETGQPNMLRVFLGEYQTKSQKSDAEAENLILLQTNIDNMSAEILGYVMDKLFAEGALDVFHTPVFMKKSRPAVMLSVLCQRADRERLLTVIFAETTTLGIRSIETERFSLTRYVETMMTPDGEIRVKKAWSDKFGIRPRLSPEYEDIRRIAAEKGEPFKDVYDRILQYLFQLSE